MFNLEILGEIKDKDAVSSLPLPDLCLGKERLFLWILIILDSRRPLRMAAIFVI